MKIYPQMNLVIDPQVIQKFPDAKLGVLVVRGLNNTSKDKGIIDLLRQQSANTRQVLSLQALADHPKIADWRAAYTAFGSKPKTYKNSVEALLRRVLQGDELPDINPLVNLYNLISIKHILPAGGSDLDHVKGNMQLTCAKGGEQFTVLGGKVHEVADPGEVIYRDDVEVLCRRWNWRESDKTKMTAQTKNVCLILEALQSTTHEELKAAVDELRSLVLAHCGGNAQVHILDNKTTSCSL